MKAVHRRDRGFDCRVLLGKQRSLGSLEFRLGDLQRIGADAVELLGQRQKRRVAAHAYALDDVARARRDARRVALRGAL